MCIAAISATVPDAIQESGALRQQQDALEAIVEPSQALLVLGELRTLLGQQAFLQSRSCSSDLLWNTSLAEQARWLYASSHAPPFSSISRRSNRAL